MNFQDLLESVLYEGGAAGHMMHPYDKFKTPDDLLAFFEDFLSGKIEGTEKVDGYNLFVGYNESEKVVAVRNKNEEPMQDIAKKFDLNHPAHNAFVAGWAAIKNKLESLDRSERVKFDLVEKNGTPKNFVNLEVLYGYIPNVVPYSQNTNYIVLHNLAGVPDTWSGRDDNKLLNSLADKFGKIKVTTPNVTFSGDPDNVKREVKDLDSEWEFKGPIEITKDDVKQQLDAVIKEWRSYSEVKKLLDFAKKDEKLDKSSLSAEQLAAHEQEKLDLMKAVTKKIGSKVLSTMVSKLSETGKVVPGHPGIEGIVLKKGNDLVKITGDFLDFSKPEDLPVLDATRELREYIQKSILGLTTTTLKGLKGKPQKALEEYVMANKRKKNFPYTLDSALPEEHKNKMKEVVAKAKENVKKVMKELQQKGRDFDTKSLLVQSMLMSNLMALLPEMKTYRDLVHAYGEQFFGVK